MKTEHRRKILLFQLLLKYNNYARQILNKGGDNNKKDNKLLCWKENQHTISHCKQTSIMDSNAACSVAYKILLNKVFLVLGLHDLKEDLWQIHSENINT